MILFYLAWLYWSSFPWLDVIVCLLTNFTSVILLQRGSLVLILPWLLKLISLSNNILSKWRTVFWLLSDVDLESISLTLSKLSDDMVLLEPVSTCWYCSSPSYLILSWPEIFVPATDIASFLNCRVIPLDSSGDFWICVYWGRWRLKVKDRWISSLCKY